MNLIAIAFILVFIFCCSMLAVSGWACWKDTENALFLIGSILFGIGAVAWVYILLRG